MSRQLRYDNPTIQEHLANQFVLGTLPPRVRARLLQVLPYHPGLQQRIHYWENKMSPIDETAPVLAPKPESWQKIMGSINPAPQQAKPSLFDKLFFQWATLCSLVFCAVLGWQLFQLQPTNDPLSYVAVMNDYNDQPQVVAATYGESRLLVLDFVQQAQASSEQSLELWVKSKTDAQFRSLGEIPAGVDSFSRTLTVAEWRLIKDSDILQITLEDLGGSAIGEPMGEVVSEGVCVQLANWQEQV